MQSLSSLRRASSVGNLSSRAESPLRSGSSRIPVGTGYSNRNLNHGYEHPSGTSVPNRYDDRYHDRYDDRYDDRYSDDEYYTGNHHRNRKYRDRNHYASTPGGLNHPSYNQDSNYPSAFTSNRQNRFNHYASNPGLNKNVRFRKPENRLGRSMADIRDIEDSIQDIGTSLRDIKSISQSIKDLKYLPQLVDEQIIDRIHRE